MQRNIEKIINDTVGKINPRYDMGEHEINYFYELSLTPECEKWDLVFKAFRFCYAMGAKAAMSKNGAYNERPQNKKPCQCANTDRAAD